MRFHRTFGVALVGLILGIGVAVFFARPVSAPGDDSSVVFGDGRLFLELATSTSTRERGLGLRDPLASDAAMLFVFPKDGSYAFWMKDMRFPIDIFWLNADARVVHIESSIAPSTYPAAFQSPTPARYVLETNAGYAEHHHIQIGTTLELKNIPTVAP